jgi:hypothetical protein
VSAEFAEVSLRMLGLRETEAARIAALPLPEAAPRIVQPPSGGRRR